MNAVRLTETLDHWRVSAWRWRGELSWPAQLGLALLAAAATGLAAQIRVPLPWTPVPATGQVFAVLLAGALLGAGWGGLSQALYVGLGAAGLPWFSGWAGGMPLGPTAGYLLGFIPAAVVVGGLSEHFVWARRFPIQVLVMALGVEIIYLFGWVGFLLLTGTGLVAAFWAAVYPFIGIDMAKAIAAAAIAATLLPRQDTPKTPHSE
jgi:biotin transport system substrate-specific component